jgi:hypothetical protein
MLVVKFSSVLKEDAGTQSHHGIHFIEITCPNLLSACSVLKFSVLFFFHFSPTTFNAVGNLVF